MRMLDVFEYIIGYEDVVGSRPETLMVHPENYEELRADMAAVASPGDAKPGDMKAAMEVVFNDGNNVAVVADEETELHSIRARVPEVGDAE